MAAHWTHWTMYCTYCTYIYPVRFFPPVKHSLALKHKIQYLIITIFFNQASGPMFLPLVLTFSSTQLAQTVPIT